jgi:hypothetical protein
MNNPVPRRLAENKILAGASHRQFHHPCFRRIKVWGLHLAIANLGSDKIEAGYHPGDTLFSV